MRTAEIELYDVTNEGKGTVYVDFIIDDENVNSHPIKIRDLIDFVVDEQMNAEITPTGGDMVYCPKTYTNDNLREVVLEYLTKTYAS